MLPRFDGVGEFPGRVRDRPVVFEGHAVVPPADAGSIAFLALLEPFDVRFGIEEFGPVGPVPHLPRLPVHGQEYPQVGTDGQQFVDVVEEVERPVGPRSPVSRRRP